MLNNFKDINFRFLKVSFIFERSSFTEAFFNLELYSLSAIVEFYLNFDVEFLK